MSRSQFIGEHWEVKSLQGGCAVDRQKSVCKEGAEKLWESWNTEREPLTCRNNKI